MNYMVESIELHDSLNPKLWLPDNFLRPEVREQLELVVNEFINELEKNEIPIRIIDVHLVGSNASYNYSDTSDLDVHLVANFEEVTCDPYILSLLYSYFKTYFNDKYDISIHGVDVELFIEDMNSSTISNGIYSLYDNMWIKFPDKITTPEVDISNNIAPYYNMYKSAIGASDGVEAQKLLDDLYRLRRNSLSTDGEFGVGNLIFKEFRNNGWIDNLKDEVAKYKSQQWSLENLNETLDDMLSIESLIREARARGVKPDDIFDSYDALCNATAFFDSITDGTQQSYKDSPKKRISLNTNKNEFYTVLMNYLDSLGTGNKSYKKLEPALVEKTTMGIFPRDGRHRAQFCILLGIPLPVRFLNHGANKGYETLNSSFNKLTRGNTNSSAFSSAPNLLTNAPNVINEIMNNGSVEDDWDWWQGGGYEYSDLEPTTKEFISKHLQVTNNSISRLEMPAYSTKDNTLTIGDVINMGAPRSFSRSIRGTLNILRNDDWDPEDSCILRTTGKVQYFDGRHIEDDSNNTFAYQEEVLCGGSFEVVDITSLIVDDNKYVVYVIKQLSTPNWLTEDYLDDENKFWNYRTAPVEGNQIFDPNRGESPWATRMIELAQTGKQDDEGHIASIVKMTPLEYFEACADGFETSIDTQINQIKDDKDILDELKQVITKYKVRFPITYLNYSNNSFGQEGRHRMYVAAQLFGWDVKYPVLVVNQTEEGKDKQRKELLVRYINKALDKALLYSYNNIQDIKEELQYLLEYYLDNFTLDVIDNNDTIIITVNGVSIQVDKSDFNFTEPDDDERIDDIDIDDFIDVDDLDDILKL